ncbi:hypothetical protein ACFCX4_34100, partial [Kitasatospora sp. NPDC056327]|uniref:hypothetical protein n=1 Tax=Kitasatospora sp. NPDC056327 TaxID=3345785 RepID=UPI0035D88121
MCSIWSQEEIRSRMLPVAPWSKTSCRSEISLRQWRSSRALARSPVRRPELRPHAPRRAGQQARRVVVSSFQV